MDDLSLLLACKDLFLSMSGQKVKTLKQAQQMLKNSQNQKLQTVIDQYNTIDSNVISTMNDDSSLIDFSTLKIGFNQKDPLSYYWQRPSITQIIGQKGTGKTGLALQLALQFAKNNPNKEIKILNCSGGITHNRMIPFKDIKHQYIDVFCPENIQDYMGDFKKRCKPGMVILDGVNCIIMGANQRVGLGELLITLKEKGWSIIVTNLIQGKLEVEQSEVLNAQSYFPNIFGSIVDCRLRIDSHEQQQNIFVIHSLKNVNSKLYRFISKMTSQGLGELIIQKW